MNNPSNEVKKPFLNNYFNYKVSIGEAILFFLLTLVVGQSISGVIAIFMNFFPVLTDLLLPLSFLLGFGVAAALIMVLKKLKPDQLKHFFHTQVKIFHIVLAIVLYFAIMPLAEYLSMSIPTEGYPLLEELYKIVEQSFAMIFEHKVAAFIMICILAPLLEEFIFRGLILRGMLNNGINPWLSIIITSLLFGLAHLNPWQFAGAGLLGAVFAFIYWRTQSLWLVIFLHFLNNFIAFMITLETESLDETVFEPKLWLLLISVIASLLLGYTLYRFTGSTALKAFRTFDK